MPAVAMPGPSPGTHIRTLTGLAGYACGHTGSCCRAGWPIPVEPTPLALLRQGLERGRVASRAPTALEEDAILGRLPNGECGFHHATTGQPGCALEQALTDAALPNSCRQFPRILLADDRGWHQTLSAWCGTMAGMLMEDGLSVSRFLSIAHITADPRVHVEGLDARTAWPPLLRPGVLAGHDGYAAWERRVLTDILAAVGEGHPSAAALGSLLHFTSGVRGWQASDGSLADVIVRSPRGPTRHHPEGTASDDALDVLFRDLIERVPATWRPRDWPHSLLDRSTDETPVTREHGERTLARYLGTRLVGSWIAYQGEGLLSVAASLVACHALVVLALSEAPGTGITLGRMTDSIRAADWLVLHLLDREDWAAWCSRAETDPTAGHLHDIVRAASARLDQLRWAQEPGHRPHA